MIKFYVIILLSTSLCSAQFNTVKPSRSMVLVPNLSVGENRASMEDQIGEGDVFDPYFALPLDTIRVNSGYGFRVHPISGVHKKHQGIDLYSNGSMVYSVIDGVVGRLGYEKGYGLHIKVEGLGFSFLYAHLSQVYVSEGDVLEAGQLIAKTGSTGSSTGDHLHFEVLFDNEHLDPVRFIRNLLRMNVLNP